MNHTRQADKQHSTQKHMYAGSSFMYYTQQKGNWLDVGLCFTGT